MAGIRIKICGVTSAEDAIHAAECGADAVGLNFVAQSPRFITPERATRIIRELPAFTAPIGVFVGWTIRQATSVAFQLGLRGIQTYTDALPNDDPFPFAWIPAFRVRDQTDLALASQWIEQLQSRGHPPSAVLIDSFVAGLMGGSGQTAPWELIRDYHPGVPIILAGGLTPENVAEAISIVHPWGIDVASGVESLPGVKDHDKVRRLIENARQAAAVRNTNDSSKTG